MLPWVQLIFFIKDFYIHVCVYERDEKMQIKRNNDLTDSMYWSNSSAMNKMWHKGNF